MARKAAAAVVGSSRIGSVWLWLLAGGAMLLALSSALPAFCLFLPSFLVLLSEQDRSRPLTRAVLLFGLAGAWNTLGLLWHYGGLGLASWNPIGWAIALNTKRLAIAWAAQAGGWLLAEGLTIGFAQLSEYRIRQVMERAENRKATLQAEWLSVQSAEANNTS